MNNDVKNRWFKPVNHVGRITGTLAILMCFLPFLYLYLTYRQMPETSVVLTAIGTMTSVYFVSWIVEPISYFPALGTAGTYMGILAGSMAQMRVPAALVAKRVAGVDENTQEAEIVGTCGIAGSIFMNAFILTLTAIVGSVIIPMLPQVVLAALSAYVLPTIFGAILAMFTTKGKLPITIPTLLLAVAMALLVGKGIIPLPPALLIPISVVMGVLIGRFEYKKGWAK